MKILLLFISGLIFSACSNEYYVKAYKTGAEIGRGDQIELRSRFSTVEFEDVNLHLEWNTYDNFVINKPPYKFFVVSEPKNKNYERIMIDSVVMKSSLGRKYVLEVESWPVVLVNNNMKRDSHTFEPALKFQFGKGEVIETTLMLSIVTKSAVKEKEIKLQWSPIKVKHYAPIH